jgi:alpha-ribazole phosphatase
MRIVLVRHPAPLIEPGICYGRMDLPIHPHADIEGIAHNPVLAGSARIWSSPARRCRGLADRIAEVLSIPLTTDPRLLELDFGAWEGMPWDTVPRADLDRWAADPLGFRAPGGESGAELIARVTEFCAGLAEDCVVASHGGPLRVLSALLKGQPVDLFAPPQAIGAIVEIVISSVKVPDLPAGN